MEMEMDSWHSSISKQGLHVTRNSRSGILRRFQFRVAGAALICPHCWQTFRPEQILWVAQHEDLMGDSLLKEEPLRFLPTLFTLEGQAIDARGMTCTQVACPACHLVIPRVLIENEITFISIIGSAGSGKSNFLAAMTWELRKQLARHFAIIFTDGDKEANWILNRYEETLFLPDDPDRPVFLEKTRTQGDLYRSVPLGGQETQLPKPFLFTLHPSAGHPRSSRRNRMGRIVCLYDNAGEHYAVGQDTSISPVTRHLSQAKVLMFLFDPTQDSRSRQRCKGTFHRSPNYRPTANYSPGIDFLSEATSGVRKHASLSAYQRYERPLLVLVGKSDIWASLISEDISTEPIIPDADMVTHLGAIDIERVNRVSKAVRNLLLEITPEIVTVAEDFARDVVYMPVSALGHAPENNKRPACLLSPAISSRTG